MSSGLFTVLTCVTAKLVTATMAVLMVPRKISHDARHGANCGSAGSTSAAASLKCTPLLGRRPLFWRLRQSCNAWKRTATDKSRGCYRQQEHAAGCNSVQHKSNQQSETPWDAVLSKCASANVARQLLADGLTWRSLSEAEQPQLFKDRNPPGQSRMQQNPAIGTMW